MGVNARPLAVPTLVLSGFGAKQVRLCGVVVNLGAVGFGASSWHGPAWRSRVSLVSVGSKQTEPHHYRIGFRAD